MQRLTAKRQLGRTGIAVPPIIFGTSAFGNLFRAIPYEEKRRIAEEWFERVEPPVVLDSAGKYGAGLSLETIGRLLGELGVENDEVVISNKLGWKRVPLQASEPTFEPGAWFDIDNDAVQAISYSGIMECWQQGCELLGEGFRPALASVHDPDEYLAAATDEVERGRRFENVLEAYRALAELRLAGEIQGVGVGAKDWRTIREISERVDLDWVMFACSFTVYTHPAELIHLIEELSARGIGIVNSAVFNAGFLIGGDYFDYRKPDPAADAGLFTWREHFFELCERHRVKPADACVEFGLSLPEIAAVALNTGRAERVRENVESVEARAPAGFWSEMKEAGLVDRHYPHLG